MKKPTSVTLDEHVINTLKIYAKADKRSKSSAHQKLLEIAFKDPEVKRIIAEYKQQEEM